MKITESSIRIGIVSSVNSDDCTARVFYPDSSNMVSGWLYVLQRDTEWMPAINDRVLCVNLEDEDGYILGAIK